MNVPEMRDGSVGNDTPKNVDDTKMLNTTARESVSYDESNDNKEWVKPSPSFGPLGSQGRM